jgi:hypothetical protein
VSSEARLARGWPSAGPGWPADRVDVVDSDLGQSGSSAKWRAGFQRVAEQIAHGHIGLSSSTDPIGASGPGERRFAIEGSTRGDSPRRPTLLLDIPEFVVCRGGQYFFLPGNGGLAHLVGPSDLQDRGSAAEVRAPLP